MNEDVELLCRDCDAVVAFVSPALDPAEDDGSLMCVLCGTAITFGGWITTLVDEAAA